MKQNSGFTYGQLEQLKELAQQNNVSSESQHDAKLLVSCLICPSCGNSDKYVKYYNEDMICQGCGYDLGQITANLWLSLIK